MNDTDCKDVEITAEYRLATAEDLARGWIQCPFCGMYPYVIQDVIDNKPVPAPGKVVDCCEYGDMMFGMGFPYENVREKYVQYEGHEPPFYQHVEEA